MKTVARLSAEDRSDLFRNTANRMQMSDSIHADTHETRKKCIFSGHCAHSISGFRILRSKGSEAGSDQTVLCR